MSVSYDSYKVFYYVAKYQNTTLAAKALFLTQPTVSHYILALEKELDCKLFSRSKKGMHLTPEGTILYRHISRAFSEISRGEEELKSYLKLESGLIKAGASETTLRNFLMPYLGQFRAEYPGIRLRIVNVNYLTSSEGLKNGSLDFSIMTTPYPDSGLSATALRSFSMIAVAGRQLHSLSEHPLSLKEVSMQPIICLESGTAGRLYLDTLFASSGVALRPDVELSSADLIVPMTIQNVGIGFVPRLFAKRALQEGLVFEVPLQDPLPERSICLLLNPSHTLSLACKRFLSFLRAPEPPPAPLTIP